MKKVLYSLALFICLFVSIDVVSADYCYYKNESKDLYFIATISDYENERKIPTVGIEKEFTLYSRHKLNTKWTIGNWYTAPINSKDAAYNPTGTCPKMLLYVETSGTDEVYFGDSESFLNKISTEKAKNVIILNNYTHKSKSTVTAQDIDSIGNCYYQDPNINLKYHVSGFDSTPIATIEAGNNYISIGNINRSTSTSVFGGTHVPAYTLNGNKCPKYLITNHKKAYFSDDDSFTISNYRVLYNYNNGVGSSSDIKNTGNCKYSTTSANFAPGTKIEADINSTTGEVFWLVDGKLVGTGSTHTLSVGLNTYTLSFPNEEFEVNGKKYNIQTYYSETNTCAPYKFQQNGAAQRLELIYNSGATPDGGDKDTNIDDENYKSDYDCTTDLDYGFKLVMHKGATNNGNKSDDKVCLKYNNSTEQCFTGTTELTFDNGAIKVGVFDENVIEYYKTEFLANSACPVNNDSIFIIKDGNSYIISTSKDSILSPLTSKEYLDALGSLVNPLTALAPQALNYKLKLNGNDITLKSIDANDLICSKGNCTEPKYQTEEALRNVKRWCNKLQKYDLIYNPDDLAHRREECESFDNFYDKLVEEGIISNLASGCGFISDALRDKLDWILDLIKIAGPILAIVLGMLDFTKVLINGDPDKETKEAFKRLRVRLFAAALLFIIPIILEIPLNIILGDKLEDDPFCEVRGNI